MCGKSKVVILGKSYSSKNELVSELLKMPFYANSLLTIYTDNPEKDGCLGYEYIQSDKLQKMYRYEKIRNLYMIDGYNYGIKYKMIRYAKVAMITADMLKDNEEFSNYSIIYVDTDEEIHKERIKQISNSSERLALEEFMLKEEQLYSLGNKEKYDIIIKKDATSDKMNIKNIVYYIQSILKK